MSTDVKEPVAGADAAAGAKPRSKKLTIAGILIAVMLVQAALGYMLIPKPADPVDKHAHDDPHHDPHHKEKEKDEHVEHGPETVEVELEPFNCSNTRAAAGTAFHITFKLVAVVAKGQDAPFAEMATKQNKARVRETVLRIVRSATLDDLNDPNLAALKRLIREDVNKLLRKSYVIEIVMSDYKVIEQ